MSIFLEKVRERKGCLREWIQESVRRLDEIVDECFPKMFGKEWRVNMHSFPTETRTKLLTYIFNHALDETAGRLLVNEYTSTPGGKDGFACRLFNCNVRKKLSLGKSTDVFASGARNAKDINLVLAIKIDSADWKSKRIFAGAIDLSVAENSDTKWHIGSGVNFASLKIGLLDSGVIVPICGKISSKQRYTHLDYETTRKN